MCTSLEFLNQIRKSRSSGQRQGRRSKHVSVRGWSLFDRETVLLSNNFRFKKTAD